MVLCSMVDLSILRGWPWPCNMVHSSLMRTLNWSLLFFSDLLRDALSKLKHIFLKTTTTNSAHKHNQPVIWSFSHNTKWDLHAHSQYIKSSFWLTNNRKGSSFKTSLWASWESWSQRELWSDITAGGRKCEASTRGCYFSSPYQAYFPLLVLVGNKILDQKDPWLNPAGFLCSQIKDLQRTVFSWWLLLSLMSIDKGPWLIMCFAWRNSPDQFPEYPVERTW